MAVPDAGQLSLDLGLPALAVRPVRPARPSGDTVFFAATPPPEVAEVLTSVARQLGAEQRLRADWRPARVLHVSLAGVGLWDHLPQAGLRHAREVGAALDAEAFRLRFATALVFGKARRRPFVLCCDEASIVRLAGLARSLRVGLAGAGRPAGRRSFVPHLTLGYTQGFIEPAAVDLPGWTVRDVVLVRSRHGAARHEVLGRWPLRDPLAAAAAGQQKEGI
jgi:2'-5' RNA ligase